MEKKMPRTAEGMHPEDIKAALRARYGSLEAFCALHGYSRAAASYALKRQWTTVEALIAKAIDRHPSDIWPDRYDHRGRPLSRRRMEDRIRRRPSGNVKKRAAA